MTNEGKLLKDILYELYLTPSPPLQPGEGEITVYQYDSNLKTGG
jgi:hypothetical protein